MSGITGALDPVQLEHGAFLAMEPVQLVTRSRVQLVADDGAALPQVVFDSIPTMVASFQSILGDRPQEVIVAAFVDMRRMLIGWQEVFRGTLTNCAAEPRAVLQAALLLNAARFVLCHNHPTGAAEPSPQDIEFTRRMKEAADLLGIQLLDHLVVGADGDWASIRRLDLRWWR